MINPESIDFINKSILISVFLIGFVSGGALAVIIHSLQEKKYDKE